MLSRGCEVSRETTFIWPDIAANIDRIAQSLTEAHSAAGRGDAKTTRIKQDQADQAQHGASVKFGYDNYWTWSDRPFSLAMLGEGRPRKRAKDARPDPFNGFDHAEFFWQGRLPAALIVHNYGKPPQPERDDLVVEQLPASWYNPGQTVAYIITPRRILTAAPTIGHTPSKTKGDIMYTYVKLHQDGKQVAISTNAAEEHEFIRGVSDALLKLNGALSTGELEAFLPQVVDICCRMRGYKNTVDERRVLIAGRITPTEESVIASSAPIEVKAATGVTLAET